MSVPLVAALSALFGAFLLGSFLPIGSWLSWLWTRVWAMLFSRIGGWPPIALISDDWFERVGAALRWLIVTLFSLVSAVICFVILGRSYRTCFAVEDIYKVVVANTYTEEKITSL